MSFCQERTSEGNGERGSFLPSVSAYVCVGVCVSVSVSGGVCGGVCGGVRLCELKYDAPMSKVTHTFTF